jgi:hypothetical protein
MMNYAILLLTNKLFAFPSGGNFVSGTKGRSSGNDKAKILFSIPHIFFNI